MTARRGGWTTEGGAAINAPRAQGPTFFSRQQGGLNEGPVDCVGQELGHIVAVSLDEQPLATSRKILLQVMSEGKISDYRNSGCRRK
jgi:hypothetical protein